MHRVHRFFAVFIMGLFVVMPGYADVESGRQLVAELKPQINKNTDEDIVALYQGLTDALTEYEKTDNTTGDVAGTKNTQIEELKADAQKLREKEQSLENRLLGAAGQGIVGIGGMQTMSAMAEQSADDVAEQDMRAYLATFRCDYGQGRNIVGGQTGIQLPGANELLDYVTEYQALALRLLSDKNALGMAPGIESELVLDSATMNLYNNKSLEYKKGAFTSLARALQDETSTDAYEWNEQQQSTLKKRQIGTAIAVGGAVATLAANLAINRLNNGSDASKADTDDEYVIPEEDKYADMSPVERIDAMVSDLKDLIAENERKMTEYNDNLHKHQEFIKTILIPDCKNYLKDYIDYINGLKPLSDKLQSVPEISYDLTKVQNKYTKCTFSASNKKSMGIDTKKGLKNVCQGTQTKNEKCIRTFKWAELNMIQAVRIAKEYARVVDGKTIDYCDDDWHEYGMDDWVSCITKDKILYTFQFDDVTETDGDLIRKDTAKAVCEGIYKGKSGSVAKFPGSVVDVNGIKCTFDVADAAFKCDGMRKIFNYFDFQTYDHKDKSACSIYFTPYKNVVNESRKSVPVYGRKKFVEKNTYSGIDNFEFRKGGFQMRGDIAVVRLIEHWLSIKTGVNSSKIRCNDGTVAYHGDDAISYADDILGCFINGKRVDLVFDDFSENWNDYTKKFLQAGVCKVNNSVYTGSSCIGNTQQMDQQQCTKLKKDLQWYCPNCASPEWDSTSKVCKTQENAKFVEFVDTTAPAIGLTVASVALAVPSGGASVVGYVGFATASLGALATGVSYYADYYMASEVQSFINKVSSQCHANPCMINGKQTTVEDLLKEYLTRMLNLKESITSIPQADALNKELVRLLKLLPNNTRKQYEIDFNKGGNKTAEDIQNVKQIADIIGKIANGVGMGITFNWPANSAVLTTIDFTVSSSSF